MYALEMLSWNWKDTGRIFLAFPFLILSILAVPIDPRLPAAESQTFVHCMDDGAPIQLRDPFDPSEWTNDNFTFMEWVKISDSGQEKPVAYFLPRQENLAVRSKIRNSFENKVTIYETWGIQISPVSLEDSATYKAEIKTKSDNFDKVKNIMILVARAPHLASETLTITKEGSGNQHILRCGKVASLGEPPINLMWMDERGNNLSSTYENGYLTLKLKTTSDLDELSCQIDQASLASRCIPRLEEDLWDASHSIGGSTSPSPASTTGIIVGIVVTVVFLIILVVAFCICRRRKFRYNTKKGEKKKRNELVDSQDPSEGQLLRREVEGEEAPRLPSKPTSPYMVSNVNPANQEASHYASSPVNKAAPQELKPAPVAARRVQKTAPMAVSEETSGVRNGNGKVVPTPLPRTQNTISSSKENLTSNEQQSKPASFIGTSV